MCREQGRRVAGVGALGRHAAAGPHSSPAFGACGAKSSAPLRIWIRLALQRPQLRIPGKRRIIHSFAFGMSRSILVVFVPQR